jgi:uncharacterized membrane protein
MKHHFKNTTAKMLGERANNYPYLVRIHSLISTGFWLILFTLCYLAQFISPEGGLSNLAAHSLLFTIQIILILGGFILTPLWEVGLRHIALDFVRSKNTTHENLLAGFRCSSPLLVSALYQGYRYTLAYLISNISSALILSLLPFSQAFYQDATYLLENPTSPLEGRLIIAAVVIATVFIPILIFTFSQVFYRYRMSDRLILDHEQYNGIIASLESKSLIEGYKKQLFQIDIRYWWYYLANLLSYLLPITLILINGLDIPLTETTEAILLFSAIGSMVIRLLVLILAKPKLAATYAIFYDHLTEQPKRTSKDTVQDTASPSDKPKNTKFPWQY